MKEAFGGIYTLLFIAIFLVIVIGVLGFVVAYTKAFHMKNDIIYTIERYEGSCCGGGSESPHSGVSINCNPQTSLCRKKIAEKAQDLGYNPVSLNCPSNYAVASYNGSELFCYKINNANSSRYRGKAVTYSVITQVDIGFPIIKNILGMSIFQVSGDTRAIQLQD